MSPRQYGSMSSSGDDANESLELIPNVGDSSTQGSVSVGDEADLKRKKKWVNYALAALVGVIICACYVQGRYQLLNVDYQPGDDSNANSLLIPNPLSSVDPLSLGFRSTTRHGIASPSKVWQQFKSHNSDQHLEYVKPLPTNAWYMNLLSHKASDPSKAGEVAHVYTTPYIIGVSPPSPKNMPFTTSQTTLAMAGIDMFLPVMKTSSTNIQVVFDRYNGASLGALVDEKQLENIGEDDAATSYHVIDDKTSTSISPLGVGLQWNHVNIKTYVVRGMPYGTVVFGKDTLPTIMAGNHPTSIIIDNDTSNRMQCGTVTGKPIKQVPLESLKAPLSDDGKAHVYRVQNELSFHLKYSDFTWVVYFSKPVNIRCFSGAVPLAGNPGPREEVRFRIDVTEVLSEDDSDLVVRMAVADECTTGESTMKEHCDKRPGYETLSTENRLELLRKGKDRYPKNPLLQVDFPKEETTADERISNVVFDWDFTSSVTDPTQLRGITQYDRNVYDDNACFMFALPHHIEALSEKDSLICLHTFHGKTCLVDGDKWELPVQHGDPQSFLADRPPLTEAIPDIADALSNDVEYKMSSNMLRGAADTYFPAKILARVGRVIEIANELKSLSDGVAVDYSDANEAEVSSAALAAAASHLPSDNQLESLLDDLQESVEIWLKPFPKGAEAEFLYDQSWGGFVNCGCAYTFEEGKADQGTCTNAFPSCPALADVNVNFGNGFYNDHHFHYGYHITAASVVAKNRPEWGKRMYERVLMYIRDIANPSIQDKHFPLYRQKDFYLGNSWAAGLMSMELSPHGREQESSSEAIAAYEGIALFGAAMMDAFKDDEENLASARLVRNVGELLTSMEVSASDRFWHVWGVQEDIVADNSSASTHTNSYPAQYDKRVVGMMHETMASFQTWFSPYDVVSYGIQLIPFTAVAQRRDDLEWAKELYPEYAQSCEVADIDSGFCEKNGWSIAQACLLAETGEIELALSMAKEIPKTVYSSEGAAGHSYTNTLWFISTRKRVEDF